MISTSLRGLATRVFVSILLLLTIGVAPMQAVGPYFWNNATTGNWSLGASWTGTAPTSPGSTAATEIVNFAATTGAAYISTNDLLTPPYALNQLVINNTGGAGLFTLAGNALSFGGASPALNVLATNTANANISAPITLAASASISNASSGGATLTLGAVTMAGVTATFGGGSAISTGAYTTTADGATITLASGGGALTIASITRTAATTLAINNSSASLLTVTGAITGGTTDTTTFGGTGVGGITIGSLTPTTAGGTINNMTNGTLLITTLAGTTAPITNSAGSGAFNITNHITGTTNAITNSSTVGILTITNLTANNNRTITAATGATINLGVVNNNSRATSLAGAGTINIGTTSTSNSTGSFSNSNTGTVTINNLTISGASLIIQNATTGSFSLTGTTALTTQILTFSGVGNGVMSITGTITGTTGGLNSSGGSVTVNLTSTAIYTGATTAAGSNATLRLLMGTGTTSGTLNSASNLVMSGGQLLVDSQAVASALTQTFTGLASGTGNSSVSRITLANAGAATSVTLNLNGALTRTTTGLLHFNVPGGATNTVVNLNSSLLTNGILGGFATFGTGATPTDFMGATGAPTYTVQDNVASWAANQNITDSAGFSGTLGASTNINSLRFNAAAVGTVTIGGGTALTIGTALGGAATGAGGILVTAAVGANATSITGSTLLVGPIYGTSDLIVHQYNAGAALTINSAIHDSHNGVFLGVTSLIKTGPGTLILGGANTFSGGMKILGGTVQLNASNILSPFGSVQINTGTTLNLNGTSQTVAGFPGPFAGAAVGTVALGAAGGTLTLQNAATVTIPVITGGGAGTNVIFNNPGATITMNSANTFTGTVQILGGTLAIGAASHLGAATNSVTINGGTLSNTAAVTFTSNVITIGANGGTINVGALNTTLRNAANSLLGSGNLSVVGTGVVAARFTPLTNSSTFSGTLSLSGVGINLQNVNFLASNSISVQSNGQLILNAVGTFANNVSISGDGPTDQASGILRFLDGAILGTSANTLTLRAASTIGFQANSIVGTINSQIIGAFGFTEISSAASPLSFLVLGNANNKFTGGITVGQGTATSAGSLRFGVTGANPVGGTLTINALTAAGGTVDMNGTDQTFAGLTAAAASTGAVITNNSGSTNSIVTFGGLSAGTTSFAGVIRSGGTRTTALTVIGGSLTLSGLNIYTGGTNLNGGTLTVDNVTNLSAVLPTGLNVTMGGGTLNFFGRTAAVNFQSLVGGGLTIVAGGSTMAVTQTGTSYQVNLGAITRTVAGGTIDFTLPTGAASATNGIQTTNVNNAGGTLGGYATIGGSTATATWAIQSGSNNNIAGLASFNTSTTLVSAATTNADPTFGTVNINNSGANTTINTLRLNGAGAYTITPASAADTLTIASGGILITTNVGANAVSWDNGAVSTLTSGTVDLIVHQYNTAGDVTIGSQITGGIALTKTGGGRLILSNATNNYANGTFINAGILQIGAFATLGGGNITMNGGARLQFSAGDSSSKTLTLNGSGGGIDTNGNNVTLTGVISGVGGLTKFGAGILTIGQGAANTYGVQTTINAGTLRLATSNALPVNATTSAGLPLVFTGVGATLDLNGTSPTIGGLQSIGAGTITNSSGIASTLTLNAVNSTAFNFGGSIDNAGGTINLSLAGATNMILVSSGNNYAGTTAISSLSTLTIGANTTTGTIGTGIITNNGLLTFDRSDGTLGAPVTFSAQIDGTGRVVHAGIGVLYLSSTTSSYSGGTTLSNPGTLQVQHDSNLGAAAGSLTFGGSTATLLFGSTFTVGAARTINLIAAANFHTNGFNPQIDSSFAGTNSFTKVGAGTLTLTNGFSGGNAITVVTGTLTLNGASGTYFDTNNDIAGISTLTVSAGTTLNINATTVASGAFLVGSGPTVGTSSIVNVANNVTLSINGAFTLGNLPVSAIGVGNYVATMNVGTTVNGGAALNVNAPGTSFIVGNWAGATVVVNPGGTPPLVSLLDATNASKVTINVGLLQLAASTGSNAQTGTTGTVILPTSALSSVGIQATTAINISTDTGSGTGNVGTLRLGGGTNVIFTPLLTIGAQKNGGTFTLASAGTGSLLLQANPNGGKTTLTLGRNDTPGATTTAPTSTFNLTTTGSVNATLGVISMGSVGVGGGSTTSTIILGAAGGGLVTADGVTVGAFVTAGASLSINANFTVANATFRFNSGTTGFVTGVNNTGTGNRVLTVAVSGGLLDMNGGTINQMTSNGGGGTSSTTVNLNGTGTLQNAAIGNVTNFNFTGGTLLNASTIARPVTQTATTSSVLQVDLTQTTAITGAYSLTGTSGAITAQAIVNGTLGATGGVTVGNFATLLGNGAVSNNVLVNSGGTIAPGNSTGKLTLLGNTFAFSASSTLAIEVTGASTVTGGEGNTYDQLVLNNATSSTLTGGTLNLTLANGFDPTAAANFYYIVNKTDGGSLTGAFTNGATVQATNNLGTFQFDISYAGDFGSFGSITGGNDVVLYGATLVPEPHHIMMICVAVLGMGYYLRRRLQCIVPAVR